MIEYIRFSIDMALMLGMCMAVIILDPIFVPATPESHRIPDLNLDDSILKHLSKRDESHYDNSIYFDKL